MKVLFDIAKAQAIDKRAFNESARQQWNRREKTCRDVACLDQWYAEQRLAYSAMITPNSNSAQPTQAPAAASGYRAGPPLGAAKALPPPQTPSIPTLSAAELFRIYDENEVAADLRFKGRLVRVEGTVESINVSFSGSPIFPWRCQAIFKRSQIGFLQGSYAAFGQGQQRRRNSSYVRSEGHDVAVALLELS